MKTLIQCRECWLIHDATFECDGFRLWLTEAGKQELERRKTEAYQRAKAQQDDANRADGYHWAQKAGAPYEAIAALRRGPRPSIAIAKAKEFNEDPEALFLLLLGPTGVGKTLAATLVAVHFAARWPWNNQPSGPQAEPLKYADCAPLTRLSVYDDEARRYVETLRMCRLLVLEEAGDEGTDLGRGVLVELLMARHDARRRTVITGNLRPDVFRARYGAAVADRISSSGYAPNLFGERSQRNWKPVLVKT